MNFNVEQVEKLIAHRRTIKPADFSNREVSAEIIEKILASANWAPTHGYTEPWRFVVFKNNGLLQLANFHANLYKSQVPPESFKQVKFDKIINRGNQASVVIAIVMKKGDNEKIPEIEELLATGCAVQNMLLTATAMSLGSYWGSGGMTYHPEMTKFLGYSAKDKTLGFIYLGYPKNDWPKGRRVSAISEKVTWKVD